MSEPPSSCIRTLRLKVKWEAYPWLSAAAIEVNQVWHYANETSYKAANRFAGPGRWLSAFDLNNLTAGAAKYFERIAAATIQRVNAEFATRRKQFKKTRLRWRVSRGKVKALRFSGKAMRVFERELLEGGKRQVKRLHRTIARRRKQDQQAGRSVKIVN